MGGGTALTGPEAIRYVEQTLGHPMSVLNRFPKYFLIETVNVCNARCVMCGIDFDLKRPSTMTSDLFDKLASEFFAHADHIEKIMLYLDCEPLLDKHLASRVRKLKSGGIRRVNIASNASLLTSAKAEDLISAGLDEIYITIDSLRKETFEAIRVGLTFETVTENARNFIAARDRLNPNLRIRLQMIQQDSNRDEGDAFVEHWREFLGPRDEIAVQKAHNWASTVRVMRFGDEDRMNLIPCIALWGTFCVHVTGDVGLCCMDTTTSIRLGNVSTESIADIWAGDALRGVREKHLSGSRREIAMCDGCTLWRESKRELKRLVGVD